MAALSRFITVLEALIIRDLMMRFGRQHMGFIWTILEPMILCTGVMCVWSMIKEPVIHGIPLITFILTGYMPLTLWRHMTGPMVQLLSRNVDLLYHQPISHVHIMLARSFLEFFSTTAALIVMYFVVIAAGLVEPIADPGLALAGWLFTAWYFGATGFLVTALTEYWEVSERFIQPWNYLQLPLSGVFFMVDWMPNYAQKLLLLNPSVHCFEMFRAGFLGGAITTHYSADYLAVASVSLTVVAAAAAYHLRDHVQIS